MAMLCTTSKPAEWFNAAQRGHSTQRTTAVHTDDVNKDSTDKK